MLKLSSYDRLRYYLSMEIDEELDNTVGLKRELNNWILSTSKTIETFLDRQLEISSYTEYFGVKPGFQKFWVRAPLISAITSVKEDPQGLFDGSESTLDNFFIGHDSRYIALDRELNYTWPKAIQVVYTGGLAYDGVKSTFVVDSVGAMAAGNFVLGGTSGAFGIIRTASGTTLVVENLYGVFEASETLTEYSDDSHTAAKETGETCIISSISKQSLAEAYPDIVRACEMEVRYRYKHKDDFELTGSTRDSVNLRRDNDKLRTWLTTETQRMLLPYKRPFVQ